MSSVLEVAGLTRAFGGIVVANNIALSLAPGDRSALIGPNGAGKTTFINLVTGALRPGSGSIRLAGEDITKMNSSERVRRGLVRTFQITRLFPEISVVEHVVLAVLQRERRTNRFLRSVWADRSTREKAEALLSGLGISAVSSKAAGDISYGQQRLVEIAVALALRPRVLLLDEPAAGVPQSECGRILEMLERLPGELAVLMIEHDMDLVFRFAKQIIVLAAGQVIAEGAPQSIAIDPNVRTAYLGSYCAKGVPGHG